MYRRLLRTFGKLLLTAVYGFLIFHITVELIPTKPIRKQVLPKTTKTQKALQTPVSKNSRQHNFTVPMHSVNRYSIHTGIRLSMAKTRTLKYNPNIKFSYPLDIDMLKLAKSIESGNDSFSNINVINPHPFSYIINSDVCSSDFQVDPNEFSLIILIKSAAGYFSKREAIRKTWGNFTHKSVRMVFLLGASQKYRNEIEKENSRYSDIVQEDFVDAYRNNTYKTIMGFNWVIEYCSKVKFLFFVDDDYIVNIQNVIRFLLQQKTDKLFTGFLLPKSTPYRNKGGKWYISWEDYPHEKWPPYIAGGGYIVSMKTAKMFHHVFPYVRYLGIDDSYLGIVAFKLKIQPQHNRNFRMTGCKGYFYKNGFGCHHSQSKSMVSTWEKMKKSLISDANKSNLKT